MQKFFLNIMCRFRVPKTLTVDNGKQFDCKKFRKFCTKIGTNLVFVSVYHPESNRAVERDNREFFAAITKTLFGLCKGIWTEELPRVIWSHNTTASRTTKYTPFKLLHGEEAMTPEEIKFKGPRTQAQCSTLNKSETKENLESIRLQAVINILDYQKETTRWRDKNIVRKDIKDGDLVLRQKPSKKNRKVAARNGRGRIYQYLQQ